MIWFILIYVISLIGSIAFFKRYVQKYMQKLTLSELIQGAAMCLAPCFNTVLFFVFICMYFEDQPEIIVWKRKETP